MMKLAFGGKCKRVVLALVVCVMMLAGTEMISYADASPLSITATMDSESGEVTVKIVVTPVPETVKRTSLFILNPHDPAYTLQDITDDTLSDVVYISKQGVLDENGECIFTAKLSANAPGGWYQVKVGKLGLDLAESDRSAEFYYANPDEINEAKGSMNGADSSNIEERLYEYSIEKPILGLNLMGDYTSVPKEEIHTQFLMLRDAMPDSKFITVTEIQTTFNQAVGFVMMNNVDDSQMDAVIRNYGTVLQLEENDDYLGSTEVKMQTHTVLEMLRNKLSNTKFNSLDDLKKAYRKAIAIGTLNCSGRAEITNVLQRYNDIFELDLNGDYADLGDNKIEVNKALFQMNFTDLGEIQKAFEGKIEELKNAKTDHKPTNNGSSGGGGKGGVSYNVTVTNQVPVVVPEIPDETEPEEIQPSVYFSDIEHVEWARESIEALAERKIISGTGANLFEPDTKITREQFLKMLINCIGLLDSNAKTDFTDIAVGQWYYPYIASAQKAGIASGMGDGTFGLEREITRQEMAVFIDRAVRKLNITLPQRQVSPFEDEDEIDGYATQSVRQIQQAGIINGVGDNRYLPQHSATRAEAAKIIHGVLKLIEG